ncbi:MAG: IS481 family transposase, partial [Candidatus Bathyarchaeia archaeon]
SRLITGYALTQSPTAEHTIEAFQEAFRKHGIPREALTDRGSQFYANAGLRKAAGVTLFQAFLSKNRVEHIVGRVNHPQTRGKVEHLYRTLRDKAHLFTSIEECVRWYNELKPHLSLDFERAETPIEAHARKLPKR